MTNVVSLFNGMSCGRIALDVIGEPVGLYLESEVDKHAMKASRTLYPQSLPVGDVTRWREWAVDWSKIDLIMGGSPCQGFSSAGKQGGTRARVAGRELVVDSLAMYHAVKAAGGEFLSQSHLFWEFVDVVQTARRANPGVEFMLENVKMTKQNMDMITKALGVEPVFINSALVSAQSRQRWYWCSWSVEQPDDLGIVLADIIEDDSEADRDKSYCIDASYYKGGDLKSYREKGRRQLVFIQQRGRGKNNGGAKALDGKTPTLTSNNWENNNVLAVAGKDLKPGEFHGIEHRTRGPEIIGTPGKAYCLSASASCGRKSMITDGQVYRKLTPRECARLQTIPEHQIDQLLASGISNTQLYKMLGNGWTISVIAHLLRAGGFGK